MNGKQKTMPARILTSLALLCFIEISGRTGLFDVLFGGISEKFPLKFALYVSAYLVIGFDILRKAGRGILNGSFMDENFLMAVATLGAFSLEIFKVHGNLLLVEECNEGVAVMIFYQIGEFFQKMAVGKSRKNIAALMDIRPDYANIEKDGRLEKVDPNTVEKGSLIVVQAGEKIAIDGIVEEGRSFLNTAALTGESVPVEVSQGDEATSGSINQNGLLKIRTTKVFGESTVSKILELVEDSGSKKSKSEEFISKFARIYTPAVVFAALAISVAPPLFCMVFLKNTGSGLWTAWIYRALTFLVTSCPCALAISIPLSFFAGIGGAGSQGILIKGSSYLERLSKTKTVVFDKTGTLTKGVFEVQAVHHSRIEEAKIIEFAALAECASSHPISQSLRKFHAGKIDRRRVSDIEEISGHGITATVDGHRVAAGNSKLMEKLGLEAIDCHHGGTIIHVAIDGKYSGHIVISDVEKPTSKEAIVQLKKSGVSKTVMLTGDRKKTAEKVAERLGLDEFYSDLLPEDKVAEVELLLELKEKNSTLAFVGDGMNDAPVLSRADIGIAMGGIGSDAAIEAADIVLMDDDPMKISKAIKISRKCMGIVRQNIAAALGIKFACLVLGAFGKADMWLAIFADVGVMVIAVLNAVRSLNVKRL